MEAVCAFARENVHHGARYYPRWLHTEQALRGQLAELLHAPSVDDIALLKNTSEGLSLLAYGLDWREGDNIIIAREEFPSNRIVWESLARFGVTLRQANLDSDDSPEDAMLAMMDERTRLLSVSSVQYATGRRMDVQRLGIMCRRHGVLFCVDAIQSLGVLPLDVQAVHADVVVADGHKWMLGPEGLAVFYCAAPLRPRLRLTQYGWHMVEHHGDYDRRAWQPAASARRFECGSPNMLGIHALHASLSLLLEVGIGQVARQVLTHSAYLIEVLSKIKGCELLSPTAPDRYAGIVTFRLRRTPAEQLWRHLMDQGVICACRGGGVRFSPHYYTTREQLTRAVELVARFEG